jgi:uncharacterized protein
VSLIEHRPEGQFSIRAVRADCVLVGQRELTRSFLIAPDRLVDWSPVSLATMDDAAIDAVLALQPALVLLGTGARQSLPAPRLLAAFLARGIGLEAMDNAAAARTFNLLASEGRRVVGAFLLQDPAAAPPA